MVMRVVNLVVSRTDLLIRGVEANDIVGWKKQVSWMLDPRVPKLG